MAEIKRIAIIPARRGSKRCPEKNVAKINGIPLPEIGIRQAIETRIFNEIIVSTDDAEIKNIAQNYNVTIHEREADLAGDFDPIIHVIKEIIKSFSIPLSTHIYLLLLTNPLRRIDDIVNSQKIFENSDMTSSVVSVTENEYPMEMLWKINEHGRLYNIIKNNTTRKQDFSASYKYNDACIIDTAENFLIDQRNLFGNNPVPYFMPPERSIYIDYPWQLELIKMILEKKII